MFNIKKVYFDASSQYVFDVLEAPKPAKNYIPQWYKNLTSSWKDQDGWDRAGAKTCMPFLDSFVSGYIHELACDLEIKYVGKNDVTGQDALQYKWYGNIRPIMTRQEENNAPHILPKFDGYYNTELQWYTQFDPKTPKGYSTMYHHPSNRFDLPFHTFTGITDTDNWNGEGPVPFLLKEGFEGIIPAGTPIIQFTFIKRENWTGIKNKFNQAQHNKIQHKLKSMAKKGYKKLYWQKKEYN
jgi:hypothetical protein